ncbi:hypothetical protein MNBD_GAMMA04-1192 [hydrothermal vent metagenome]|uniref:Uncharacterized protein n=1 Tax=hydrothermal vent metagenome TaxID=652676 RepID=A0A3B0VUC1_9ZZZZ
MTAAKKESRLAAKPGAKKVVVKKMSHKNI